MFTWDFIRRNKVPGVKSFLLNGSTGSKKMQSELYLVGDIFDFWHEYRHVIPKGHTRFLGKLAEMSDRGIKLHYFTGNHDVWVYDYLPPRWVPSFTGSR